MKYFILFLPFLLFAQVETRQLDGPNIAHILVVNPKTHRLAIGLGQDSGLGVEGIPSLAKRSKATAAVNGGFFFGERYLGGSASVLKIDGITYALCKKNRGVIAWNEDQLPVIDRVHSIISVNNQPITGFNVARGAGDAVLYSWPFHRHTLTDEGGTEYLINEHMQITSITKGGNAPIPTNGYVLSVGSESPFPKLKVGQKVHVEMQLESLLNSSWGDYTNIIGGTPVLVHNGRVIDNFDAEQTIETFITKPHPRTAVGLRPNGDIVFVVVDGHSEESLGMTIPEIATFMHELGCVNALNLDGGSSSTMVDNNSLINVPSTKKHRALPVGNGILIMPN